MSLFCLCVVEDIKETDEIVLYTQQIEVLARCYKIGVKFCVDWSEPIISHIKKGSLIINILDSPESDNCELFLLPDGWSINGQTNMVSFIERMKFLQDISTVFNNRNYPIDLYLGESGTNFDEFLTISLNSKSLPEYLSKTVGTYGVEAGVHIKTGDG